LQFLGPGEQRAYRVEIGVLDSPQAIAELEQRIRYGPSRRSAGRRRTGPRPTI
jgi:hypothetical protein